VQKVSPAPVSDSGNDDVVADNSTTETSPTGSDAGQRAADILAMIRKRQQS
jgi:hypothetical protein